MIQIFEDFIPDVEVYRKQALDLEFKSFHFDHCSFHGIAIPPDPGVVVARVCELFPSAVPTLTFLRKSPAGQEEPHFIHSDIDMGDWTALLYLNPDPPLGDGTLFWTHPTGAIESFIPHERSEEGRSTEGWQLRQAIQAKLNKMIVFPSSYFHSRAIYDNWGDGDTARLTQVVFGRGEIFA